MAESSIVDKILRKAEEAETQESSQSSELETRRQTALKGYGVSEESMKAAGLKLLPLILKIGMKNEPTETYLLATRQEGRVLHTVVLEKGQSEDVLKVAENITVSLSGFEGRYSRKTSDPEDPSMEVVLNGKIKLVEKLDLRRDVNLGSFDIQRHGLDASMGFVETNGMIDSLKDLDLSYQQSSARVSSLLVTR
ncbi:hypothetical protein HY502_03630 [Candidatus Woesebacteria bacterium]|nr:hypothetical protein [Candidatus Woesebacteria bacterium]